MAFLPASFFPDGTCFGARSGRTQSPLARYEKQQGLSLPDLMRAPLIRRLPFAGLALLLLLFCAAPSGAWAASPSAPTSHSAHAAQAPAPQAAHGGDSGAAGNGTSGSGRAEAILVAELVLLLATGRLLGEGMQRIGQPALMGQLLAGIVLGPSLFGWLWPAGHHFLFPGGASQQGMIDGLSQVGILMLLLLTGMETDLRLVRKSGFAAVAISLCGIAAPFLCGFLLGQLLPATLLPGSGGGRLVPSLFLGTALSISSVKIVAMVVREMNFMRRNLGQLIVATAIMEDTVGWVIIAITFGIAGAGGRPGGGLPLLDLALTVGGVLLFLGFCFTGGRWLVFGAIRWANDNFRSEFPVITMILVIMGIMALITHLLGVRTVLGAFMAGVLIGESPILTGHIQQQLRGLITAFFMPVFFGLSGLSADLTILKDGHLALLTAGLVAIASVGKFAGAFAGSMLARFTWREGAALGCAMNARGSTEVIVASIGLSMGALSQNLYTMIVTMAVLTTMAMPPMLRAALSRIPMSEEEKLRVARETMDEKGFVPKLERLLLAADESAVGRMAARLAGLLAGAHGMPVTIVKLDEGTARLPPPERTEPGTQSPGAGGDAAQGERKGDDADDGNADSSRKEMSGAQSVKQSSAEQKADPLAREVKTGARKSAAKVIADSAEPDPDKVHLTTRVPVDAADEVVRDEARKGYDLMFIGLEGSVESDGGFAPGVGRIAGGFEGPLLLLVNRGEESPRLTARSRILLPVNGSPQSRRAAEIVFAIARGAGARVHCLFVTPAEDGRRRTVREEGILKDLAELGERYEVDVTSRISPRGSAAEAILKESRRGFSMIVMGVSIRPGEQLFFGNTAAAVLKGWNGPILLAAS
jgi:Kef-type K+ transport system membrane component KefB/nucleotide-binding universal stress UspA family protein